MRALLIHNPTAGTGGHAATGVKKLLQEAGYLVTEFSTKERAYKEALNKPTDLILVAGGDGSVTRVVRHWQSSDARLAILPLGTANNIARSLGIEGDADGLLRCVTGGLTKPLDVGLARGPWGRRRFVEGIGVGLLANWMQGVNNKPAAHERTKIGRETLKKALAETTAKRWTVSIDGHDMTREALSLEILNGRFVGPALPIGPRSEPGDQLLDVVYLPLEGREDMLAWLDGPDRTCSPFVVRQGRKVILHWDSGSLHIDDRVYGPRRSPIEVKVKLKALGLRVCVPH
jgi:diacylglycerol kinase (ATP)